MILQRRAKHNRMGVTAVQTGLVLVVVMGAVIGTVRVLGTTSNDDMGQTAAEVSDPASLVGRFGSSCISDDPCSTDDGTDGTDSNDGEEPTDGGYR